MSLPPPALTESLLIKLCPSAAENWAKLSQELWDVYKNAPLSNATDLHVFMRRCGSLAGNFSANDAFPGDFSAFFLFDEEYPRAPCSKQHLYKNVIPFMAALASKLPYFFPKGLPILRRGAVELQTVELSKIQVCAVLSAAFFAIIPFDQNGIQAPSSPFITTSGIVKPTVITEQLQSPIVTENKRFKITTSSSLSQTLEKYMLSSSQSLEKAPSFSFSSNSKEATSSSFSQDFKESTSFFSSYQNLKETNSSLSSSCIDSNATSSKSSSTSSAGAVNESFGHQATTTAGDSTTSTCTSSLPVFCPYSSPVSRYLQPFDFISSFMSQTEKVFCLMAYFVKMQEFVSTSMDIVTSLGESLYWAESLFSNAPILNEKIGFYRRYMPFMGSQEEWQTCTHPLQEIFIDEEGFIEDADGCLQADFANKYIGGGVLTHGCLQEEIRFLTFPENLVAVLFAEKMNDAEAIITVGAEQFSRFSGYAESFQFCGICKDDTTSSTTVVSSSSRENPKRAILDGRNRLPIHLTAFDALPNPGKNQYKMPSLLRELRKSFCAFSGDPFENIKANEAGMPVATGNWGCGAFRGDPQLKGLLQWLAASAVGRSLRYFPVKNREMASFATLGSTVRQFCSPPTVGEAFKLLLHALTLYEKQQRPKRFFTGDLKERCGALSLFDCLHQQLEGQLPSFTHQKETTIM